MTDKPTTTVNVAWENGFKFRSQDAHGHTIVIDAPENDGEQFDGMMPASLLLSSLAGCSGIDVVNILRRQRQDITSLEIKVNGMQQPDPPWIMDEIELEYIVKGNNLNEVSVKRAIELSEEKYCFVGATLGGRSQVRSTFRIIEG